MTTPPTPPTFLETLSPDDRILYAIIAEEERRKKEAVSPKMELARNFKGKIIGARGGRSAGAKTTSMVSLNVQQSHRARHRVVCLREIQESLEESLYQAVEECVDRLELPGWRFPRSQGYCESPTGSHWIFRGLKDLRAARNTKGLQGFDRFIMDEAATIIGESLDMVIPLLGKVQGSQLWFAYNPETDSDPIFTKVWLPYQNDPDALLLDMQPEGADNPWWNSDAQKLSDKMRRDDPDLWEHVYGGKPRSQGEKSVLARAAIRAAMDRTVQPSAPHEFGVDVARFGDDKITVYERRGMKAKCLAIWSKIDTQETGRRVWDLANRNVLLPIKVDDTGVGGGVTDKLRDLGANAIPVNFGGKPNDEERYTTAADEMWFSFGEILDQVEIDDDPLLMEELSTRRYGYTSKNQRKIESKDEFKKRMGRSPDRADGLLLSFYRPTGAPVVISAENLAAMRARRNRSR